MTARAYTGPFPCNLTRSMAEVFADEATARITNSHHEMLSRGARDQRERGVA